MLVGVDTRIPAIRRTPGPDRRWLQRLLRTAAELQGDTRFLLFTDEQTHKAWDGWDRVPVASERGGLAALLRGSSLANVIKQHDLDLILAPLDNPVPSPPVPQVLYAVDLAPWEPMSGVGPARKGAPVKEIRKACAGARRIVTASQYLRRRCLDFFEAALDRVTVAPPGVDAVYGEDYPPIVEPPYFMTYVDGLCTGRLELFDEVQERLNQQYGYTLVVAGPGWAEEPEDWSDTVVRVEYCPEAQLAGLYRNAAAFLYLPLHDGMAIPVLEAVRAGAPVVAPRSGALEELAGNSPFYYNPDSSRSMLQNIRRVLEQDPTERQRRTTEGRRTAAELSWEKSAWKMLSAFKEG